MSRLLNTILDNPAYFLGAIILFGGLISALGSFIPGPAHDPNRPPSEYDER